jgi:hypothetical protein
MARRWALEMSAKMLCEEAAGFMEVGKNGTCEASVDHKFQRKSSRLNRKELPCYRSHGLARVEVERKKRRERENARNRRARVLAHWRVILGLPILLTRNHAAASATAPGVVFFPCGSPQRTARLARLARLG